jgi:hypothetical protein
MIGFDDSELSKRATGMLPTSPDQIATGAPQTTVTDIDIDLDNSVDEFL